MYTFTKKKKRKKLVTFQNRCLRQLLKIRWPDTISNVELHHRAETTGKQAKLLYKIKD